MILGSYEANENVNIKSGSYFNIDLRKEPFSLAHPVAVLSEDTPNDINKFQLLYRGSDLRKEDFKAMKLRCSLIKSI